MFRRRAATSGQRAVARRFGVAPAPPWPGSMVGTGRGSAHGVWPLHGLRHPPEGATNGWYLWCGTNEIPQNDDEFFDALHVEHMDDTFPALVPYLALPPGWRVLLAPDHEDVWYDPSLLDV